MTGLHQPTVIGQAHAELLKYPSSRRARLRMEAARVTPWVRRINRRLVISKYAIHTGSRPLCTGAGMTSGGPNNDGVVDGSGGGVLIGVHSMPGASAR